MNFRLNITIPTPAPVRGGPVVCIGGIAMAGRPWQRPVEIDGLSLFAKDG